MDYKDIVLKDRNWRITKFDARTGSKIVKKLVAIIASFFRATDVKRLEDIKLEDIKIDMSSVINALGDIKDEDFDYIQTACLKVVSEVKGTGFIPVMNDNGTFGVIGLDNDTMTVLHLTAHALVFNVTGFFQESPLASMFEGMFSSFRQNLKI